MESTIEFLDFLTFKELQFYLWTLSGWNRSNPNQTTEIYYSVAAAKLIEVLMEGGSNSIDTWFMSDYLSIFAWLRFDIGRYISMCKNSCLKHKAWKGGKVNAMQYPANGCLF